MTMNKKVYFIIGLTLFLLTVTIVANVAYNFQNYGQKKANETAKLLANTIRDGLTTMMVTGSMDKRAYFLDNIAKHGEIKNIRIMRSASVIGQYGNGGLQEHIYDDVEKAVIDSKKEFSGIVEKNGKEYLRVVIPYIAVANSTPDCLSCHQANKGDALGAISMDVDISDAIEESNLIVLKVTGVSLLFAIVSLAAAGYYIRPYIMLFDKLEDGITQAYHGDFSYKVETTLGSEAGLVAKKLNNLSEIFLFKKTIERDKDKKAIYERLNHIFQNNFKLQDFWLIEVDNERKNRVTSHCNFDKCDEKTQKFISANDCRALRIGEDVVSTDFENICGNCLVAHEHYLCIPFDIRKRTTIILNIEFESAEEVKNFGDSIPIVKNYLETAKPVLESKILMSMLEESSLKDPMTGLYNRRFLDNFIDNELKGGRGYAALMFDIDFFKMVNDAYGHDVGDRVIKTLAFVLDRNIKDSDVVVRYGGEEFLAIIFDLDAAGAVGVAENIRKEFAAQKIDASGAIIQKTVSVGVAIGVSGKVEHWQTIKFADEALYVAKNGGRNKTVVFESNMHKGGEHDEY